MAKKQVEKKQENYAAPIICAIVIVIALLAVVVATVASVNSSNNKKDDNQVQEEDGTPDYTVLTNIESQDVLDFLSEKKTGFMYIGRPTCPSCKVFAPILTKDVKAEGYTVYYYDTDVANSDKDLKTETLDALSVTGVPTFMYIKDGVEVERLSNTQSEEALREFIEKHS